MAVWDDNVNNRTRPSVLWLALSYIQLTFNVLILLLCDTQRYIIYSYQ